MCGRFVLATSPEVIQQAFDLDSVPTLPARYNIAPSQPIPVITNKEPRTLNFYRWGLIPPWAKDTSIANKTFNARSETAHEKPTFRAAFARRRCLIPATGFYEWAKTNKQPLYIHLKDEPVFAFAGLWEHWQSPEGDEIFSATILTGEPNELVSRYHDRMAVILRPEDYSTWLSADEMKAPQLMPLLQPFPAARMDAYEVSKLVNSPANDSPDCILPLSPPQQESLL